MTQSVAHKCNHGSLYGAYSIQDKTPGVLLNHRAESALQINCDDKVWLELVQVPFLEELELTAAQRQTKHISVRQAPQLQRISNSQQLPLVLHLDLTEHQQALHIEGPIEHFDFCWQGGDYVHQGKQQPQQLMLCPVHLFAEHKARIEALPADACLVLFARQGEAVSKLMKLNTQAEVIIVKVVGLELLKSYHQCQGIQLHQCPDFRDISGSGKKISLYDCGKNQLVFNGYWETVELVGCGVHRLTVQDGQTSMIRGVCYIENPHVPDYLRMINQATNSFQPGVVPPSWG